MTGHSPCKANKSKRWRLIPTYIRNDNGGSILILSNLFQSLFLSRYLYGLKGNPTNVLDCIDDVATKAELLGYCQTKGFKVIASLGAGLKVRYICIPIHTYIHT